MPKNLVLIFNLAVSAGACAVVAGVSARASFAGHRDLLDPAKSPGTAWALRLWGFWWLSLFFTYVGLVLDVPLPQWVLLPISDFGNLAALSAAIAYCRGGNFRFRTLEPLCWLFALVALWDVLLSLMIGHDLAGRVLLVSPAVLLSGVAILAIGWSVFVRCGWNATPYLALTFAYAIAQFPAFLSAIILPGAPPNTVELFALLRHSLLFLAIGKLLIVTGFFGYFFSPEHTTSSFQHSKMWPDGTTRVPMHPTFRSVFRWAAITLVSAALAALGSDLTRQFITRAIKALGSADGG